MATRSSKPVYDFEYSSPGTISCTSGQFFGSWCAEHTKTLSPCVLEIRFVPLAHIQTEFPPKVAFTSLPCSLHVPSLLSLRLPSLSRSPPTLSSLTALTPPLARPSQRPTAFPPLFCCACCSIDSFAPLPPCSSVVRAGFSKVVPHPSLLHHILCCSLCVIVSIFVFQDAYSESRCRAIF